ncbi:MULTISPECIES: GTPase HflX [Clostridium]|uniref:GTPase HflX n=1 Tax=Clostridium senegalense TaxID=1465809 RepID=A0A6M0GZE1_9CLOT|nr:MULTISPECIES: GTPase HflX [Clostridium]NEU03900.1 GTPase HflX [Clostridium senegalense]
MIDGNIDGVKKSILNKLEVIQDLKVPRDTIVTLDIVNILKEVTLEIEREVSVAIDRKGNIVSIAVGDSSTVDVPLIDVREGKLSGVRVIHTHPNGNPKLSALDISALIKLKLDAMVAIAVSESEELNYNIGFCDVTDNILVEEEIHLRNSEKLLNFNLLEKIKYIEDIIKNNNVVEDNTERAVLVGTEDEESLEELEELAKACEVVPVYSTLQKRSKNKIDPAFYIGRGKVEEVALIRQSLRTNVVIFDEELSGAQVRNLEQALGVKVIDRTTLILEIFARRAKSKEGKIQVELSQLKYRLSRLAGLGTVLSRTGGGIGTRGPGEKKLETDKRHIRERILDLSKELDRIKHVRVTQREKRSKDTVSKIALAGYTNAGKSTLRNKLCDLYPLKSATVKEKVFEADMLFATLDTTTRGILLPDNRVGTITDTVGFIRKLPHDLVEAFKSTLEEVIYADLVLHVVDSANSDAEKQIEVVEEVLKELKADDKPTMLILNKIDNADEDMINNLKEKYDNYEIIEVSARENINLDLLLNKCTELLPYKLKGFKVLIPYSDSSTVAYIHRNGKVDSESYEAEGTLMEVQGDEEVYNKCKKYIVE